MIQPRQPAFQLDCNAEGSRISNNLFNPPPSCLLDLRDSHRKVERQVGRAVPGEPRFLERERLRLSMNLPARAASREVPVLRCSGRHQPALSLALQMKPKALDCCRNYSFRRWWADSESCDARSSPKPSASCLACETTKFMARTRQRRVGGVLLTSSATFGSPRRRSQFSELHGYPAQSDLIRLDPTEAGQIRPDETR